MPAGCKRVFRLKCDIDTFPNWTKSIENAILNSIGRLKKLDLLWYEKYISKSFDFWRFMRIPERAMFLQAETGDLILAGNKKSFSLLDMKVPHFVERVFLIVRPDED